MKFIPGEIKNLELVEDVKTAGSIALILQVLIPAVSITKKKLSLIVKGGTDVHLESHDELYKFCT